MNDSLDKLTTETSPAADKSKENNVFDKEKLKSDSFLSKSGNAKDMKQESKELRENLSASSQSNFNTINLANDTDDVNEKDLILQERYQKVKRRKLALISCCAVASILVMAAALATYYDLPSNNDNSEDEYALFICGGKKDHVISEDTEIFAKSQFCQGPDMPSKKARHVVGVLHYLGRILLMVCGGVEQSEKISVGSCFAYDGNDWITSSSMIVPVASAAYTTIDNKLYVIGGRNNDTFVKDVQIYDPSYGIWTLGKSLSYGLVFACAVSFENNIIVAGGEQDIADWREQESQVWFKSAKNETSSWTRLPRLLFSSFNPGCTVSSISGKTVMLVVGGSVSYYRTQIMLWNENNPYESKWTEMTELNRLHQYGPPVIFLPKENIFRVIYGSQNAFSDSVNTVEEIHVNMTDDNINYSDWSLNTVYNITHEKHFVAYTQIPAKLLKCQPEKT